MYGDSGNISELFPINEVLILDRKTSELWLFRVMDFLFQQNSIGRYPLLENIFIYIEKHIKEDITLNSIIENCAISQGYLSRIFREQFQVSVTEYLHMKKLHLAKGYFYFTEDSIAEVAFRLGYNESSYFSKVFKKFENMTVKQYKNKIRQSSPEKKTETGRCGNR
jgi:two-component system response regulator YesN